MAHTLYIVGIGPGNPDYVVPKGLNLIKHATVLVGSERSLEDFKEPGQITYPVTGKLSWLSEQIERELHDHDVVVMVSGDTGYYSLLPYLKKKFPTTRIEVVPGISSMTFAFARLNEVWHDADLMSFHGRQPAPEKLVYEAGKKMGFLTDPEYNPAHIARILIDAGWPKETRAAALERLSYDDEKIVDSTLEVLTELEGFGHSVMYISFAQMAGGMGAGIVPLSKIYAAGLHTDASSILSQLAPATTLGNIFAIIGAIVLARGFANTKFNGHGVLIPVDKDDLKKSEAPLDPTKTGVGMMLAFALFLIGVILNAFIPKVHSYAFMIIIVFVLKALDIVPKPLEEAVVMFNRVIMTNLTHAVLAGIGLSMIDLSSLAQAMTWQFVLISLTSVVSMGLASWILGQVLGMYPVETAIGAGMINNSMGGTGNIAVLSAADRMEMIAFAQMANRLGGAIVLILGGILIQFLH